eukprot:TRINITY_DN4731_c4_g1_i1.p1 TRINITY_DN4731_c4_g1~~TRINITY_DN4731_c4_g1_i1.p1  ORF type:complete len:247 (+),score=55.02 TRINITY_DN4731_c4_g1_i1:53-742(+)
MAPEGPEIKRQKKDLTETYQGILNYMIEHDTHKIFHRPVVGVEGYSAAIKTPMCYSTIAAKIEANEYKDVEDFESDMVLIYSNCISFNQTGSFWFKEAIRQHKLMAGTAFPKYGLTADQYISYEKETDDESSFLDSEKREARKLGGPEALARARNIEASEGLKNAEVPLEQLLGIFGDPAAILKASKELLSGASLAKIKQNNPSKKTNEDEEEEDEESTEEESTESDES